LAAIGETAQTFRTIKSFWDTLLTPQPQGLPAAGQFFDFFLVVEAAFFTNLGGFIIITMCTGEKLALCLRWTHFFDDE
jgi:hypothetical protein